MVVDEEMHDMVVERFGEHSVIARKVYSHMYWRPKLRNIDKHEKPDNKLQLSPFFYNEEKLLRRICVDDETQFTTVWVSRVLKCSM